MQVLQINQQNSLVSKPNWEHVKLCISQISYAFASGQAVAVSPHFLLASLHNKIQVGTKLTITNQAFGCKSGVVFKQWFQELVMDIALIKLDDDQGVFPYFLNIYEQQIQNLEKISVVSLQPDSKGVLSFANEATQVFMVESSTTLCRASYYAIDGLSGCAAITKVQPNGEVMVIGVHIGS